VITNGTIPLVDLVTPHHELESELVSLFKTTLKTAAFVGGPMVEAFERGFAEFCGVQYCAGVGSGTDALRFALIAAGVRSGDTVVTVPNTSGIADHEHSQADARVISCSRYTWPQASHVQDRCDRHVDESDGRRW